MGFSFNRISDFFVVVVVVHEVLHERGFSELRASCAKKNRTITKTFKDSSKQLELKRQMYCKGYSNYILRPEPP